MIKKKNKNFIRSNQEYLLDKAENYILKTLFLFAINHPDKAAIYEISDGQKVLQLSPFIYLLDECSPQELKILKQEFRSHYFIPLSYMKNLEDYIQEEGIHNQKRAQFKEFEYSEKKLSNFYLNLNKDKYISIINEEDFLQIKNSSLFQNHFTNYETFKEFNKYGLGVSVKVDTQIVSLASSFCHANNILELQIDTQPNYQNKGYARAAAALFLDTCIKSEKSPRWDAATLISEKLGHSLGFKNPEYYYMFY